ALLYYRDARLLDDDSLTQLLGLDEDYGPEVLADGFNITGPAPSRPVELMCFFRDLRPLDWPTLWPLGRKVLQADSERIRGVGGATRVFWDDWQARGDVPQWEVTAFWWASQLLEVCDVSEEIAMQPASTLGHHLHLWRESFRTALAWVELWG